MKYQPVIGLEIHVRLRTKSKMFCGCANTGEDAAPNTHICPVCTGQPGALPVLNKEALELGIKAGKALGCKIPDHSKFDRKNYFYPDLPKGFQISQFDMPIAVGGKFEGIGITRAHLEDDAGKLMHSPDGESTLVDFNRSGAPLLEIVTEPDFVKPEDARRFLGELQTLMRTIGASDADMEKGHMRADANISLKRIADDGEIIDIHLNPKTEIKNVNSMKSVERALLYEIQRQTKIFEDGQVPSHATRGWNDARSTTEEQRSKEEAHDYRYFPEPDLPPLNLAELRNKIALPELPAAKRARFVEEYDFAPVDARTLVADPALADFAEAALSELKAWVETEGEEWEPNKKKLARLVAGWLLSKLGGVVGKIDPENFAEFLTLIHLNRVNSAAGLQIITEMAATGKDPSQIMEDKNLGQVEDVETLSPMIAEVIAQNPDVVEKIKSGNTKSIKFLVGIIMKQTEGRASPTLAERMIKERL